MGTGFVIVFGSVFQGGLRIYVAENGLPFEDRDDAWEAARKAFPTSEMDYEIVEVLSVADVDQDDI